MIFLVKNQFKVQTYQPIQPTQAFEGAERCLETKKGQDMNGEIEVLSPVLWYFPSFAFNGYFSTLPFSPDSRSTQGPIIAIINTPVT